MAEQGKKETPRWIALGQFGAPAGVKGHVRLNAFTERPESVFAFRDLRAGDERKSVRIEKVEAKGKQLVVSVAGVESREAAQRLRGKMLYADRAGFPPLENPDQHYQADLVGLEVADENGMRAGEVAAFHDFGAGALMEIARGAGKPSLLVPFRSDVVVKVDVAKGRVSAILKDWL